jgi:hypothetical protein
MGNHREPGGNRLPDLSHIRWNAGGRWYWQCPKDSTAEDWERARIYHPIAWYGEGERL